MRKHFRFWTLSLCLIVLSTMLRAQTQPATSPAPSSTSTAANPKTPEEFFARARQLSDLEAAGIPFHLKATYVASGDTEFTGNGTYEEWWKSKDLWRKETTLGSFTWIQIKNGGEPVLYTSSPYVPLRLRQTVAAFPIRIDADASASTDWKSGHKKMSGMDLTFLFRLYDPASSNSKERVGQAYAFTPEGILRMQQLGQIITVYNRFQPFQNLLIPSKIDIAAGSQRLLTISIETMEPLNLPSMSIFDISSIPKNLLPTEPTIHAGPKVIAPRIVYDPPPSYPAAAKQQRIQGTVVIDATVDNTGKIREPYVLAPAGEELDQEALKTIRQWRYKPLMIDSKPVAVDTTISVVFSLRQ